MPKFATHYNPPEDVRLKCSDASLTQQEFADETDLNKIMDRYAAGLGVIPICSDTPIYGDFSNLPDFATAQQIVIDAQAKFDSLPSRLRERFDNDPAQLLAFLSDENNRSEAVELGLIPSKQEANEVSIGGGSAAVADNNSVPADDGKGASESVTAIPT